MKEVFELRACRAVSDSKITSLASKLILSEYWRDASLSSISKETGLGREEIAAILSKMGSLGYRTVYKNSDRFELVKL